LTDPEQNHTDSLQFAYIVITARGQCLCATLHYLIILVLNIPLFTYSVAQ